MKMNSLSKGKKKTVLIIGGGASGMVAAIEAARYGSDVILLEKENRVGKKLLATGNGRCNFANTAAQPRHFHGADDRIVQSVLKKVPVAEVLSFFEMIGITSKEEEDGKIYPYSDQGSNVLDLLRYEMQRMGVLVKTEQQAASFHKQPERWRIETTSGDRYEAEGVILAAGGKAGSQFGANESGYHLAKSVGHTLTPLTPALVQIKLEAPWLKTLKGVKWQGAATVTASGKPLRREKGELLFTDYGISGPPILQLSRHVHGHTDEKIELWIHLLHDWTSEAVENHFMARFHLDPDKPAELCLVGLFHKRLIPVLFREAGISSLQQPAHMVPIKSIKLLASICQNWKIPITGTLSWQQAQVTSGGVSTREINPDTMASLIVPGLYLTGEIMDVDGDCGGFNLYWAWATGMIAGRHAAAEKEAFDAANTVAEDSC